MINKILEENEEVIYKSKANPDKTSMQLFRFVMLALVLAVFYYGFFFTDAVRNAGWPLGVAVLLILTGFTIYGLLDAILLKHRRKNEKYYITNKRVILIDRGKHKVEFNNIADIEFIQIGREKGEYGDIIFAFDIDLTNEDVQSVVVAIYQLIAKKIAFSGVQNPRKVAEIIKTYHPNPDLVHVVDDKIKFGRTINEKE